MSAEKLAALRAEQTSEEARTAEGIMLSKMLDGFANRVHMLYDIGKALPAPFDALGESANSLLHDYTNMAFAFKEYVERGAANPEKQIHRQEQTVVDPVQSDFDDASNDPTAQQILTDAVARLETLIATTADAGKVSDELVQVALNLVLPTFRLLRYDVRMFENSTPEQRSRIAEASEAAGDLAIARAVLSAEPKTPDFGIA